MSAIYTKSGKLLIKNGKIAVDEMCCNCLFCNPSDTVFCITLTVNSVTPTSYSWDDEQEYINCLNAIENIDPQNPTENPEFCNCVNEHLVIGECEELAEVNSGYYPETIRSVWYWTVMVDGQFKLATKEQIASGEAALFTRFTRDCHQGGRSDRPPNECDSENFTNWWSDNNYCYGEMGIKIIDCYGCFAVS